MRTQPPDIGASPDPNQIVSSAGQMAQGIFAALEARRARKEAEKAAAARAATPAEVDFSQSSPTVRYSNETRTPAEVDFNQRTVTYPSGDNSLVNEMMSMVSLDSIKQNQSQSTALDEMQKMAAGIGRAPSQTKQNGSSTALAGLMAMTAAISAHAEDGPFAKRVIADPTWHRIVWHQVTPGLRVGCRAQNVDKLSNTQDVEVLVENNLDSIIDVAAGLHVAATEPSGQRPIALGGINPHSTKPLTLEGLQGTHPRAQACQISDLRVRVWPNTGGVPNGSSALDGTRYGNIDIPVTYYELESLPAQNVPPVWSPGQR